MLSAISAVAVSGILGMAMIADGAAVDPLALLTFGAVAAACGVPAAVHRRRTAQRRRLRRVVGDPAALTGTWRRSLEAAWTARDRYAAATTPAGSSPLEDRLAEQQPVVDRALTRCGLLARDGDLLERQLRSFRVRRLRRHLRAARWRDAPGRHVEQLEARLREAEHLGRCIREARARLDAQVHELRTAAWRATELRMRPAIDGDAELADLLVDLRHLREAMDEVDAPPHPLSEVDTGHGTRSSTASAGGHSYHV